MAAAGKGGTQSRSDIVATIAGDQGIPQTQVDNIVRAYESQITNSLSSGGEVRLAGFGNFKTSQRAARVGRNPQTGGAVKIAARTVARFSPSKAMKDALGGSKGGAKKANGKAPAKAAAKPAGKAAAKPAAKAAAKPAAKSSKKK
jgi:DNA-binding protein HU-beta